MDCDNMLKRLMMQESEIKKLYVKAKEILLKYPILLDIIITLIKIVGDIYDQFFELLRLFELGSVPLSTSYIFLGYYVDRSKQSLGTICFNCLSVVEVIINGKIICMHGGGLSPSEFKSMDYLHKIKRPIKVPDSRLLCDLLLTLPQKKKKKKMPNKVDLLGDSQIGKTTLMVKYIEDRYDEDYIKTLGVNFMEKTIHLKNVNVDISIWNLGDQKDFSTLMPLVVLFAFDLTANQSLHSVKMTLYKENKVFIGTKYDLFDGLPDMYKQQSRKFAQKMHAPLLYCSSAKSINKPKKNNLFTELKLSCQKTSFFF
ncbi:serine/threonine-protein phosphatase PP1-gamma catalytic subunit-like isoform 1 [Reticulomyxa filosa]|uniref:protein-serine/threonine phosphatase n=1 Tax=Reticulomyxa filosa TaxID=46433 RepID=X6MCG8_RETFI|nr:serine/threonine-protein phosphatase PP1-gamma catalytic subunit-like isoform 1 [Reticulomyxa filosa]|eukprot:ETO11713.1 serine/threonine-protein phosphatase PP1-gamma catalytic subunit-like isoform 1 [Reticulomyxa filosa]